MRFILITGQAIMLFSPSLDWDMTGYYIWPSAEELQKHKTKIGVIITWTYHHYPYIASPQELYDDLILAYNSGAKYIVVFNYPKVHRYGVLTQEHLQVMQKFWRYLKNCQNKPNEWGDVAYILPKAYGFGFRGDDDSIWGLWKADDLANKIWNYANLLLRLYGLRLDIVYYDNNLNISNLYNKLYFWNAYPHPEDSLEAIKKNVSATSK